MPPRPAAPRPKPRQIGDVTARVIRGPREDGRWYWQARRWRDGEEQTVWTGWGTAPEVDREVAGVVSGHGPSQGEAATIREMLSLWHGAVEARGDLARNTVQNYGSAAVRLRDSIGHESPRRLDRALVERHRDAQLQAGRTPRGVNSDVKVLALAWSWARDMGMVPDRDFPRRVRAREPELRRPRAAGDVAGEVEGFRASVRLHARLLMATGARVGEIGSLRRCDVEQRDGRTWLDLPGKGRRRRSVPLAAAVADEVHAWLDAHPGPPTGWLLGFTPATSRQYLHRAIHAQGIAWTPHALRRAAVNRLYRRHVDPSAAAKLLGHSPEVALAHYREIDDDDLLQALDASGLGAPVQ